MFVNSPKKIQWICLLTCLLTGIVQAKSEREKINIPTPTPSQLAWQEAELGVLVCYELHTFKKDVYVQSRDRKLPVKDVNIFNPTELDTDQWIRCVKDMGAKFAILTVSHESGFCLWQSDANPYCLKAVKWGNGKRDILREFVDSCRKYGIKPGVYIGTRWNSHLGIYDFRVTKRSTITQEQYNKMIEAEVKEICTRYGKLFEIWFDGGAYDPKNGGPDVLSIVEKYQPDAIFYHNYQRADVRWGGSETGTVPYPCWATVPFPNGFEAHKKQYHANGFQLLKHGDPNGAYWMPAMSDTPIRKFSWFWQPNSEYKILPLNVLLNKYYASVGRNSTLVLSLNPDLRGLISDTEVNRYREFGWALKRIFSNKIANISGKGYKLELVLPENSKFDHLVLQENIKYGERVRKFSVEAFSNGKWKKINSGSCIGHKRIVRFPKPITATKIRLTISKAISEPIIKTFAVYDSLHPKTDKRQLKVLSFNVLQAGGNAANVGFKNENFGGSRIDEIAKIITSSGADIVGLQETHYAGNIDKPLMATLGNDWFLQGTILSKYKLTPIELGSYFTVCRAHLDANTSVIVINTHWWPKGNVLAKMKEKIKTGQAPKPLNLKGIPKNERRKMINQKKAEYDNFEKEMLALLPDGKGKRGYLRTVNTAKKYINAGETVIVTGDFNEPSCLDWTDFYVRKGADRLVKNSTGIPLNFRIEWKGSKLLKEIGLKDAYRLVHNNEVLKPGITWTPPYPNGTPGRCNYDDQILTRIDRIYFSGDKLIAIDAAVIGESRKFAEIVSPCKWPSDHRAVLVTFVLDSDIPKN